MSDSRVLAVTGRGVVLHGPDIDTDRIIPARFLKTVTFDGLERCVFADDREALRKSGQLHPFDRQVFLGARILIAGKNFGCGSSREHAPQALWRWGIRAIVTESFAEIFASNSLMIGLPCVSLGEAGLLRLMNLVDANPALELTVDIQHDAVHAGGEAWTSTMPAHTRDALTSGHWDGAALLLDRYEEVEATASRLPY